MTSPFRSLLLGFSLCIATSASQAVDPPRLQFTRMIAHWDAYNHPDYLSFVADARPEIVQVGFYGAHFYSLAHTPHGKGYPAHFPVQGLDECGQWFTKLNRELHNRKVKVVGHFNVEFLVGDPAGAKGPTGFFKFYRDLWDEKTLGKRPVADPLDLLQKHADGSPIVHTTYGIGGMREHWACLNNPHWQAILKAWVKAALARGVDGLVANYFYRHNCLCEYCQKGFRAHLREHFSPEQLKKQFEIADLDKHRFREIVGWHDPKKSTPLRREMLRFSQISTKRAFDEVFVKLGRSIRPDLIVAQWNHLGDFQQISGDERCLLPGELWAKDEDYLWYSTGGAACFTDLKEGILGEGTLQARYIGGATGGKPFTLGKYESTRIRVAIAELAANGGAAMGFYTRFTDPAARKEIVRYYDFLRKNDDVLRGSRPHAEVTLLYPRRRVHQGDLSAVETFKRQGKSLLDGHVLFDILPDDRAKVSRPTKVVQVRRDGKLEEIDRKALSRFQAPATVRVSASVPARGGALTLHFVNYNREEPKQKRSPGGGIVDEKPLAVSGVKADVVLPRGARVRKVLIATPEAPTPVEVPAEVKDGRLRFAVPTFLVYALARVQFADGDNRRMSNDE